MGNQPTNQSSEQSTKRSAKGSKRLKHLKQVQSTAIQSGYATPYSVFVILGNQFGDEGKGKVIRYYLFDQGRDAKFCIRFNGGPNAGHTVYAKIDDPKLYITEEKRQSYLSQSKDQIKFATHQVPTGAIFGVKSFIGRGCVVDLIKLHNEIQEIAGQLGRPYDDIANLITIDEAVHIILPKHVEADKANNRVGTTSSGIGPVYADKALRTGYRISQYYDQYKDEEFSDLTAQIQSQTSGQSFQNGHIIGIDITNLWDIPTKLDENDVVVMEGAQGFWLDPDFGNFPFTTSSVCNVSSALTYGFALENIYPVGCSKMYTTYVGSKIMEEGFEQDKKYTGVYELLRLLGVEYGVTTGRRRQCLPLNMDDELVSLRTNQTWEWIISKDDVLNDYYLLLEGLREYLDHLEKDSTDDFDIMAGGIGHQLDEHQLQVVNDYIKNVRDHNSDVATLLRKIIDNGPFSLIHNGEFVRFSSLPEMRNYISNVVREAGLPLNRIIWWDNPDSEIDLINDSGDSEESDAYEESNEYEESE